MMCHLQKKLTMFLVFFFLHFLPYPTTHPLNKKKKKEKTESQSCYITYSEEIIDIIVSPLCRVSLSIPLCTGLLITMLVLVFGKSYVLFKI